MRERNIERHLVRWTKVYGGEVRKVAWQGRRGAPDRLLILPGRVIWVELKAPGKKPTALQWREIRRLQQAGQRVLVIDSIEGVEDIFR